MVTFKNLKDLEAYVKKQAKEAMSKGNNVKNTVIEEGKRQVQSTVYDVYTPTVYERSGELKESWDSQETVDGIAVFNNRADEETGKDISYTVNTGKGYDYQFEYTNKPRPFIDNTRESLAKDDRLKAALKKDLEANGISVK